MKSVKSIQQSCSYQYRVVLDTVSDVNEFNKIAHSCFTWKRILTATTSLNGSSYNCGDRKGGRRTDVSAFRFFRYFSGK